MFNFLKKKSVPSLSPVSAQMREVMFGDMPWAQWCKPECPDVEPWSTFKAARSALERGAPEEAKSLLKRILSAPGFESRCYLQAWHYLRELGEGLPDPKRLVGVIVEVEVNGGLDVLGAYEDHTARYWNFSGAGIVWDHPDASLDQDIDALFEASKATVMRIGPWDKPRVTTFAKGMARVSFLTPSGIHFGQGPFVVLAKDNLGGPVIQKGAVLMRKLMAKAQKA